jgi:hypothetical protein
LLQEFFFHAVGAIDVLAQLINDQHKLGIAPDDVTIRNVFKKLPADELQAAIADFAQETRTNKDPNPAPPIRKPEPAHTVRRNSGSPADGARQRTFGTPARDASATRPARRELTTLSRG